MKRTETRTFGLAEVSAVVVETFVGSVDVTGTDRDDISLTATISGRSQSVVDAVVVGERRTDGRLYLTAERSEVASDASPTVDLEVEVPTSLRVAQAVVDVGEVSLTNVSGETRVRTSTGDVTVTGVDGELDVEIGTGEVTVSDVENGGVVLSLSTGDASISDVTGDVRAEVGVGDLTVNDVGGDATVSVDVGELDVSDVDGEVIG